MNRADALTGALVADAAALGLHWMYDPPQLEALAATGDLLFRHPDATVFAGRQGYFAQGARRAGQLSHYGESARVVAALGADYSTERHRAAFLASFGPCGSYVGYPDKPTKALVARILTDGEDIADASGMDDDQLPAVCPVPGLFAAGAPATTVDAAVRVLSTNDDALAAARAVLRCLDEVAGGASMPDALTTSAEGLDGELGERVREALAMPSYDPIGAADRFGRACPVPQGLPLSWHLLRHATDFEALARDNVRCGGDSCGRAMAVGAVGGLALGVPAALTSRLEPGVLTLT